MGVILDAVVPLFSLIILGFVAGKREWIDEVGIKVLVKFVFNIAMPALLFRLVVVSDIAGLINPRFLLCHFSAQALAALIGAFLAKALFDPDPRRLVILGFGASFPNSVLVGIPLMLALFDETGAVAVAMIFTFNVALYSLVTMLLEGVTQGAGTVTPMTLLASTGRAIMGNGIILAAIAGLLFGGFGLGLLPAVDRTLAFLGQAGPPMALFALGASLSVHEIARGWRGPLGAAGLMTACKLLLHPALAWVMAVPVLSLDPFFATAAVIIAAIPVGANVYIFAQHYDVAAIEASSAVFMSTALSMITIPILLWLIL